MVKFERRKGFFPGVRKWSARGWINVWGKVRYRQGRG